VRARGEWACVCLQLSAKTSGRLITFLKTLRRAFTLGNITRSNTRGIPKPGSLSEQVKSATANRSEEETAKFLASCPDRHSYFLGFSGWADLMP